MPKIKCDFCGVSFSKGASKMNKVNYCSKTCKSDALTSRAKPCETCGIPVNRPPSQTSPSTFCSRKCASVFLSRRMTAMNIDLNPDRMTPETRSKLRDSRMLADAERVSYTKYYGRHLHRIVAEEILGRPLEKGEVVHHIDGNKQNNAHENIMIFPSQAEHASHHLNERYAKRK